jgi:hypothetical protein
VAGGVRLQRPPTGRRVAQGDSEGATMFQALKDRFSKDDAAKAERKARKAETVAKRRELKVERLREVQERRLRMTGKGGDG